MLCVGLVWSRKFERLSVSFAADKMKSLFGSTILLFIGSAMCMWLWNGTKYVVEWTLTDKETLVYGIVFMPTMVINLGSSFVFKPMLTTLARHYENGEDKKFAGLVGILVAIACGLTLVTFAAGAWLGIPILSWLYDIDLSGYKTVMLVLIVAGGFNAVSMLFYYALTAMRLQKEIFAGLYDNICCLDSASCSYGKTDGNCRSRMGVPDCDVCFDGVICRDALYTPVKEKIQ